MKKKEKIIVEPIVEVTTKICRKCGIEKPIDDFTVNKNYADKHSHICKSCFHAQYIESWKNNVLNKLDTIIKGQLDVQDRIIDFIETKKTE